MKTYIEQMIKEHKELYARINKLDTYLRGASDQDDKVEFANKCIQLAAMKKYEEALRARLENVGVIFETKDKYLYRVEVK